MLIWHKNQDYQKFLTDDYVNISITLMLIDSMLLVVASSGCYGVWKRNKRMIRFYATALAAIILVQVHWDLDQQAKMVSFYYLGCCWSSCLLSERGSPFWGEVRFRENAKSSTTVRWRRTWTTLGTTPKAPALRRSPILGTLFKMIFNVAGLRDLGTGPSREPTYFLMVKSLITVCLSVRDK